MGEDIIDWHGRLIAVFAGTFYKSFVDKILRKFRNPFCCFEVSRTVGDGAFLVGGIYRFVDAKFAKKLIASFVLYWIVGKSRADAAPYEVVYVLILKMFNTYVVKEGWIDFLGNFIIDAQEF